LILLPLSLLIAFSFYEGLLTLAYVFAFLFFVVSAFMSPAKYGFLKELVGVRYISSGTSLLTISSIISISVVGLLVSFAFNYFVPVSIVEPQELLRATFPISLVIFVFSLGALFFSRDLPEIGRTASDLRFQWGRYWNFAYARRKMKKIWKNRALRQSIIGLSMFWLIVFLLVFIFQKQLQPNEFEIKNIFNRGIFYSTIGLIIGCLYASRMSRAFIETGLIPFGTAGASISIFLIPVLPSIPSLIAFFSLGFFGGVFVVPMTSMLLYNTKPRSAGHVISINNALQHVVMITFYALALSLLHVFNFSLNKLFFLLGIICLIGTIWALIALPQSLLRQLLRGILSTRYRMDVRGIHHVPWEGPVLLVGNHISYIDWALLQMACPRPLRFVIRRQSFEKWYIRLLLKQMNIIELDPSKPNEAMALANEALKRKEAVLKLLL